MVGLYLKLEISPEKDCTLVPGIRVLAPSLDHLSWKSIPSLYEKEQLLSRMSEWVFLFSFFPSLIFHDMKNVYKELPPRL